MRIWHKLMPISVNKASPGHDSCQRWSGTSGRCLSCLCLLTCRTTSFFFFFLFLFPLQREIRGVSSSQRFAKIFILVRKPRIQRSAPRSSPPLGFQNGLLLFQPGIECRISRRKSTSCHSSPTVSLTESLCLRSFFGILCEC